MKKVAVIGSRNLNIDISKHMTDEITLLISGGAYGIDLIAERYAKDNNIPKLIFKPNYAAYGKKAPLIRNKQIVENADIIIAIWDGRSLGTKYTIDYAKKMGKEVRVFIYNQ